MDCPGRRMMEQWIVVNDISYAIKPGEFVTIAQKELRRASCVKNTEQQNGTEKTGVGKRSIGGSRKTDCVSAVLLRLTKMLTPGM